MSDKLEPVAIIIPIYKNELSTYENISLQQFKNVLGNYPIHIVKPESLPLPAAFKNEEYRVENFPDHYFENIQGYNRLMLSALFYKRFLNYKHILIYQLDAFVFKDDLMYWCAKDMDYIGAPWIRDIDYVDIVKAVKSRLQHYLHVRFNIKEGGVPSKKQFENRVGNGGFSLRKVEKFHKICLSHQSKINEYLLQNTYQFNEDAFWSIELNRKRKQLKIPNYREALKFSIEWVPQRALKLNNYNLPFGCHAWERYIDTWKPIFKDYGYDI